MVKWNYASSRKNEIAITIQGDLYDVDDLADWFAKHNIVKKRSNPEFYKQSYHIYMSFEPSPFLFPCPPEKPYDLVSIDDVFAKK